MGKDAHDDGPCCHACERWASGGAEPAAREPLAVASPRSVALVVTQRGVPVMTVVPEEDVVTIGRGRSCTVTLDDGALSRLQARITLKDGRVFVEDANSTCGTFLDGKRIGGPTEIGDGAVISFGNHDVRVARR